MVEGPSYITGNAMCLDEVRTDLLDLRYLYHFLKWRGAKDFVSGSAQPQIIRGDIEKLPVEVPTLPEQRRIATVLDAWDAAISTAERLVEARTRRNDTLSRSVFPKGTPTGNRPTFSVSDLARVIGGVTYDPSTDVDGDIPILTAAHIQKGRVVLTPGSVRVSKRVVAPPQFVSQGDIAICMSNGSKHLVGKAARVLSDPPRAAFGAFCATSGHIMTH